MVKIFYEQRRSLSILMIDLLFNIFSDANTLHVVVRAVITEYTCICQKRSWYQIADFLNYDEKSQQVSIDYPPPPLHVCQWKNT